MILLALPAWAVDGTGSQPLPNEGAVTDPIVAMHPARPAREDADVRVTMELAGPTFVLDVEDAGERSEVAVLDGLLGANLTGSAGLGDRVAIGVGMPFWLGVAGAVGDGGALGDLRLQVPVAAVRPGERGAGFGLSVVPWLDVPTGDATRFLGRGSFGGGALGVVGYGFGDVRLSLNLGGAAGGGAPVFGVDDRGRLLGAVAGSWAASDRFGLSLEADVEKPLRGPAAAEACFVARGLIGTGLELSGGAAAGIARGVGSANVRLYAGVGYRFGKRPAKPVPVQIAEAPARPWDVDVRVVDEAGAPVPNATAIATRGEDTRSARVDADGEARLALDPGEWALRIEAPGREAQARTLVLEPDRFRPVDIDAVLPAGAGDARLALRFEDVEGRPVEDARVRVDGADRGVTGPGGTIVLEGLATGERQVAVEAPGFVATAPIPVAASERGAAAPLDARLDARLVVLERPRGSVKLRIRSDAGVVGDAVVRFSGPDDIPPAAVGPTGERDVVLAPGRWQVAVSSEGYGLQTREIVVDPASVGLVVVDVILTEVTGDAALALRVVDPEGRPVDGAEVLLDGRAVGRTSNGGAFAVADLAEGPRRLEVRGARFRPLPPREIELVDGTRDLLVQLDWLPGSVEVVARGPEGPVPDAMVRFAGPGAIGPEPLGPDGHGWFTLAPGDWTAALSSPAFGLQARELHVDPDQTSLLVVDAVLRAAEAGDAALVVRVRDPDGSPVDGASVRVDGLVVGTTSTGGSLRLEGLQPGRRSVTVSADLCQDATVGAALRPGDNEAVATLAWVPGIVRVRAEGPDGTGVDALARFYGVEALPPLPLGPDGARSFSLAPGKWTAVLSSEAYGLAQREVTVVPGAANATDLTMRLERPPVEAGALLVEVVDPQGAPVPGARLRLGELDHTFEAGGGLLEGLPPGMRRATLSADGYEPLVVPRLTVVAGAQERRFVLTPIPRPVRVVVRGEGGAAVEAKVRLVGPAKVEPLATAAGVAEARVRPGSWQVLVSADAYGAERRDVVVPPGAAPYTVEVPLARSRIEVTASAVLLRQQVRFQFNEATLAPESYRVLDELAATLRTDPRVGRVEIQGHTDAVGAEAYNVALSQRRADVVRDYLVGRGVAPERLVATGYGTSRPQTSNDTEAGRARNRRVQFEVLPD